MRLLAIVAATVVLWVILGFAAFGVYTAVAAPLLAPPPRVEKALTHAAARWRVPYGELRAVSFCESRWQPRAVGAGSLGLFQFLRSTWARTPYAGRDVFDPWWNALAAAWVVSRDGGWRQWTCKP